MPQVLTSRLLGPAAGLVILLTVIGTVGLVWSQRTATQVRVQSEIDAAARLVDLAIAREASKLSVALDVIENNTDYLDLFIAGDRDVLHDAAADQFQHLRDAHTVTHWYFVDPDGQVVLRMDDPDRFGDRIERTTLLNARATGVEVAGLELGRVGTLTLRVVRPWRSDGRVVGYLEVGSEIGTILQELDTRTRIAPSVLIDKALVNRDAWESSPSSAQHMAGWEAFSHHVAVGPAASQASLQALQAVIEAHGQDDMPTAHTVRLDNTHVFSLSMRPILDAAGRQVGLLTFASDITREERAFRRDAMVIGLVGLALAGLVTFLLYALTRRVNWQAAELVRAQGRTLKELDAAVRQRTAALEQEVEQRRRAQHAFELSEQRFRDFAEAGSDRYWETDENFRFISVVASSLSDGPPNPDDALGRTRWEVARADPFTDMTWRAHLDDMQARRPFRDFEYVIPGPGGQQLHWRSSGKPVFDEAGAFIGYRGVASDITAEVEAEQRRLKAEVRLARAIEVIPAAFALFDPDDRLVICNRDYRTIYETPDAPMVPGGRFEDFVRAFAANGGIAGDEADGERWVRQRLDRRARPAKQDDYERSGDRWTEVSDYILEDGSVFTVGIDITDRKRTEQALRDSGERFRQMADSIDQVFWISEPDVSRLLYVSPAYEKIWDHSVEELMNDTRLFADSIHPDDRSRVLRRRKGAPEAGYDHEYRIVRRDGSERWVWARAFPVRDGNGQVHRVAGVAEDITARKRMEAALRQAQKMEAVGQLTGGVAHDFNNLLAIVLGNLDLVEERLDADSPLHKLVAPAIVAAERGANLTRRLLAFSRKQPLTPVPLDLNALISGMDDMMRRSLGETIELEVSGTADLWPCSVDPGQMETALLNLAINARDAMTTGGKLIIETDNVHLDDEYAAAHLDTEPGDYVVISVTDTGVGMSAEVLEHAFEPFFTTKKVGEGSGLGLSMVYGFVKQSGGNVSIYSECDEGTIVRLYLPRIRQTADDLAARGGQADQSAVTGETVLVVEDDADVLTLVVTVLKDLGYDVLSARTGQAGLSVLHHTHAISLLLTDVVLPGGMSGQQLVEEVSRLQPGIRVLFMSGYSENMLSGEGRLRPGVHLIQKPFRRTDLAAKLREVLDA